MNAVLEQVALGFPVLKKHQVDMLNNALAFPSVILKVTGNVWQVSWVAFGLSAARFL